jgi:glutamate synthase domain-containing protein 1
MSMSLNRNRMHAREAMLAGSQIPGDLSRLSPLCTPEASDSASFDEVLELLHLDVSVMEFVVHALEERLQREAGRGERRRARSAGSRGP